MTPPDREQTKQLNRRTFLKATVATVAGLSAQSMLATYGGDVSAGTLAETTRQELESGGQASGEATTSGQAHTSYEGDVCADPANSIVAENCLPGTDEWQVTNLLGDIEGYASKTSVNLGETITFFVNTSAEQFDLYIFRSGYYGGLGGRLISEIRDLVGTDQPNCKTDEKTGLTTCGNWSPSYELEVPSDWVSGIYVAKLVRHDTGGENYMIFVVQDDEGNSDILYQQSVTTYQAYNYYGGRSLYNTNAWDVCNTVSGQTRAVMVSFDRPYQAPMSEFNMYFHAEYPMVHWLESQGYDVSYSTNLDTHLSGIDGEENRLLDHKMFLISGHDEYWSAEMRAAITEARDAGVHIGSFSANTGYWQVRFEPDEESGVDDRVMVCYKTVQSGPDDPSGIPTSTWRDPDGADAPENELLGIQYVGDNSTFFFPVRVTAEHAQDSIYRNTGLQELTDGTYVNLGSQLIGWEWDGLADNGHTPDGLVVLAESPVTGKRLLDAGRESSSVLETAIQTTRYVAPSGAIVFASGTIQWALGLAVVEPDPRIQQITYNLFSDMGIQPAAPSNSLILDGEADPVAPSNDDLIVYEIGDDSRPVVDSVGVHTGGTWASISWETDVPTNVQVWFGSDPDDISQWTPVNNTDYEQEHTLTVPELDPSTQYYFQIISADPGGRVVMSDPIAVKTTRGSIKAQAKFRLRPLARSSMCWVDANPTASMAIAAGAVVGIPLAGWQAVRHLRRRGQDEMPEDEELAASANDQMDLDEGTHRNESGDESPG